MGTTRILVVEDDPTLSEVLRYNLQREGYEVVSAGDGVEALAVARRDRPGLVLLDLMLPGMSGFDVCRVLRGESQVPILVLTAKADETNKVVGLELGADDYVTKPFSMKELLARVRAMLRRAAATTIPGTGYGPLRVGVFEVDTGRHRITLDGAPLGLSPKEFELLAFLLRNHGLVFSREQLLEKVWGYDYAGQTRTVDVHIRWLREKVEGDPAKPKHILTVRGVGYKLEG